MRVVRVFVLGTSLLRPAARLTSRLAPRFGGRGGTVLGRWLDPRVAASSLCTDGRSWGDTSRPVNPDLRAGRSGRSDRSDSAASPSPSWTDLVAVPGGAAAGRGARNARSPSGSTLPDRSGRPGPARSSPASPTISPHSAAESACAQPAMRTQGRQHRPEPTDAQANESAWTRSVGPLPAGRGPILRERFTVGRGQAESSDHGSAPAKARPEEDPLPPAEHDHAVEHLLRVRLDPRSAATATGDDDYYRASLLLVFALFFDMLDGRVARLTKTQSAFGLQIDSLADVVSFGVAPALLVYKWSLVQQGHARAHHRVHLRRRAARFGSRASTSSRWARAASRRSRASTSSACRSRAPRASSSRSSSPTTRSSGDLSGAEVRLRR